MRTPCRSARERRAFRCEERKGSPPRVAALCAHRRLLRQTDLNKYCERPLDRTLCPGVLSRRGDAERRPHEFRGVHRDTACTCAAARSAPAIELVTRCWTGTQVDDLATVILLIAVARARDPRGRAIDVADTVPQFPNNECVDRRCLTEASRQSTLFAHWLLTRPDGWTMGAE